MNKRLDFTQLGGFPFTQYTLDFMQQSFRDCFSALANLIGDKVIIQGCDVVGGSVSNGWISVGGEIMPFVGGIMPATPQVSISETNSSRVFDNGATNNVYFTKQATIGTPGSFPFSDLVKLDKFVTVFENLAALQAAFATHTHSFLALTDRPTEVITYRGSYNIGDLGTSDITRTIAIPDQGDANYHVVGSWVGNNASWDLNNDVLPPNIFNKTANSFSIGVREINAVVQNIRYEFIIIKTV
jgi:hypothetical protein